MSAPPREHLHELLRQAVGPETAVALMAFMPPAGWGDLATKTDLAHMQERMDARFGALEQHTAARFVGLEQGMDDRFDALEHRMLAAVRGELIGALATQTRAIIFSMVGGLVGLGGFAVALSRLA